MMISDSELSDFQETEALTFMWFVVTFVGLVVMLNTLIAGTFLWLYFLTSNGPSRIVSHIFVIVVINRSYEQSQNKSIILFVSLDFRF
jgi:hypothetical protein